MSFKLGGAYLPYYQIMYEIIDNWNSANKSLREEENFKAFKRKIMEIQNSFVKCNVRNCFSCRQN